MDAERTINLTGKPLCEFKDGDTLYIQKMPGGRGGYSADMLCTFRGMLGGSVIVDVVQVWPEWARGFWAGKRTTAAARKCFLWGSDDADPRDSRCHWFKNTKEKAT